jgi:alkylation response protein AidB-like acyl-CoA dehydrogenase
MRRIVFAEEHQQYRETVRAFLLREATPHSECWEEAGYVDPAFWPKAAAAGLLGFQVPEAHGGAGIDDYRFNAVVDEELSYCDVVGDYLLLANDIVAPYLLDLTTAEQRMRWLPGFAAGTLVAAIAMSEPAAGSDLRGIQTVARREADSWVLNGTKTFVTSGIQAGLVIVFARVKPESGDGFGLFIIEEGMAGFSKGRKLSKVGRRATDTAELFLSDVRVAEENVLGEIGCGFQYLIRNLPRERLAMAISAVASAERALELTLDYARERQAFGKPIGSFQALRFALAEMKTEVEVGRAYVDRCLQAVVDGELTAAEAAGAKFWATELQNRVIDTCLQVHGGYGYMEEYPIARMWRDARVQRIYGGTNEIMREIVGRSLGF